jgi:hypothetical protein
MRWPGEAGPWSSLQPGAFCVSVVGPNDESRGDSGWDPRGTRQATFAPLGRPCYIRQVSLGLGHPI